MNRRQKGSAMVDSVALSGAGRSVTLTDRQFDQAVDRIAGTNVGPDIGPIEPPTETMLGVPATDKIKVPVFAGEFKAGLDLAQIGEALIAGLADFKHLRGHDIGYYWRIPGGMSKGRPRFGYVKKLSGELRHFGRHEFIVVLAADHCAVAKLTGIQLEALIYHELCHIVVDEENMRLKIVGHDWEGFKAELARYGAWEPTSKQLAFLAQQLPLIQPDEAFPDEDGDDDDDE